MSGILKVRFLVLIHAPSCVRRYEHVALNHFPMNSVLQRSRNFRSPRSMCNDSMLQAKAVLSFSHVSASRLTSAKIALWKGPLSPFTRMPLLILSAVTWIRRWFHLSASLGNLMRSKRALCFCMIMDRPVEDCRCSTFFAVGLCKDLPVVWTKISAKDWTDKNAKCLSDGARVDCCYLWVQFHISESSWSFLVEKHNLLVMIWDSHAADMN